MARSGLRTGRYGVAATLRACPALARPTDAMQLQMLRDTLIGVARRGGVRR